MRDARITTLVSLSGIERSPNNAPVADRRAGP